jgi:hypothetical protein
MKKILFITLAMILGCAKPPEGQKQHCFDMTLSDALPVHFFLNEEPTFNEMADSDVIEKFCFNQEFECDDDIKVQLTEDGGGVFNLKVHDEDDEELATIAFDKLDSVYTAILNPSEIGIVTESSTFDDTFDHTFVESESGTLSCERLIRLLITKSSETPSDIFTFNSGFDGFFNTTDNETENTSGPIANWINTAASLQATTAADFGVKNLRKSGFTIPTVGSRVRITWKINNLSGDNFYLSMILMDASDTQLANVIFTEEELIDNQYHTFEYIADGAALDTDHLLILASTTEDEWSSGDVISIDNIEITSLSGESVQARTDLIRISSNIEENVRITYGAVKNYAGLNYSIPKAYGISETFTTRIPGIFFHPKKKSISTAMELSNSQFITTSTMLQKKRLLQIQDMPEYMHDMLELILNHAAIGSVIINNVEWKRDAGDDYVLSEDRPDSYPLYAAEVVLSRRNGIKRNAI